MPPTVGVDWGSGRWICAIRHGPGEWDLEAHPSFLSVWHHHKGHPPILVDVPIGLVEEGLRQCDEAARELLESVRPNSVFWTPPRAAVEAKTYDEAKEEMEDRCPKGLTTQAWGITPRIRELDEFLAEVPEAQEKVRESHPEVCFAKLNDGVAPEPGKQDDGGIDARLDILEAVESGTRDAYEELIEEYVEPPAHARLVSTNDRDDVVDAMALALTASETDGEFETLPDEPSEDPERGIPVEIVHP